MNEDKSKPNPDWITVPYGLARGIVMRDGRLTLVTYKMQDGKVEEVPNDYPEPKPLE